MPLMVSDAALVAIALVPGKPSIANPADVVYEDEEELLLPQKNKWYVCD